MQKENTERASGSQEADGRKPVLSQGTSAGTALVGGRMVTNWDAKCGRPRRGRQLEEKRRAWG